MKAFYLLSFVLMLGMVHCIDYIEPSNDVVNFLSDEEEFQDTPTTDASGAFYIGYGHVCTKKDCADMTAYKTPLSLKNGEELLLKDLQDASRCVAKHVTQKLTPNKYDALVLFSFNAGCTIFKESTVLAAVNAKKSDSEVIKTFADYIWSNKKLYRTVVERRAYEANLYMATEG